MNSIYKIIKNILGPGRQNLGRSPNLQNLQFPSFHLFWGNKLSGKFTQMIHDFGLGILQKRNQMEERKKFKQEYQQENYGLPGGAMSFLPGLLEMQKNYSLSGASMTKIEQNQTIFQKEKLSNYIPPIFLKNNDHWKIVNFQISETSSLPYFNNDQSLNSPQLIWNSELKAVSKNENQYYQIPIKVAQQMQKNYFSITLDQISYRLLGIGFPLFTLGILSGAIWANSAWGSYWSWDIKEVGSFINWLIVALYLHCRYKNLISLSHIIAFLSLIVLFFNFFGISLGIFGSSLHAYGASS